MSLTKSLRWEIQNLGQRLTAAADSEELIHRKASKAKDRSQFQIEIKQIISAIRKLLARIEDAVPLINLAITASGASLSSTLPSTVSPSRLLQASTFLTAGDSQYTAAPVRPTQIGPTFVLSLYMLFVGHVRPQSEQDIRESTWKEVIHKANVKLMRVPLSSVYDLPGNDQSTDEKAHKNGYQPTLEEMGNDYFPSQIEGRGKADEYAYQVRIIEDLDDDRVHSFGDDEEKPSPCEDVELAGIREVVPIHELSKIFYADTGKILNIGSEGEANSPILLLKRDVNAIPPRRMMERLSDGEAQNYVADNIRGPDPPIPNDGSESKVEGSSEALPFEHWDCAATLDDPPVKATAIVPTANAWRLPPNLDPEWLAFEVYTERQDSDTESETSATPAYKLPSRSPSIQSPTAALSRLHLHSPTHSPQPASSPITEKSDVQLSLPSVRTSLSLLEVLLRLLSLQQFQQAPHLSIPDELLNFFLSESASTGADGEDRKRIRQEARRRVGFDPYDESPVKRRGEEYQYQNQRGEREHGDEEYGYDKRYESDSAGIQGVDRYDPLLRYDEGYETYAWKRSSRPPHPSPSIPRTTSSPQTPPMLLKGKPSPKSSGGRVTPARLQRGLVGEREMMRRGSPLSRPTTGLTDEGLGTRPASGEEGHQQGEEGTKE